MGCNHISAEHGEHLQSSHAGADQDVDAGDGEGEEEPGRANRRRRLGVSVRAAVSWQFGPLEPRCPTSPVAACWAFNFEAHKTQQLAFLYSDPAVHCRSDGFRDPRVDGK